MTNISTLGFNGEYLDSTLDSYHLGNGYRAYNPAIMAFTAPDDLSPFGAGGINPYVYCSGDPINNTDPTGHFGGFLGVMIGVINMVSPIQVPTELTLGAAEEAVLGTVMNVGVDLATDGIGAAATPVLRSVEGVVRGTTEHAIAREVEHTANQEAGSSVDYLTSKAGGSRITRRSPHDAKQLAAAIQQAKANSIASKDIRQTWFGKGSDGEPRRYYMFTKENRTLIAGKSHRLKTMLTSTSGGFRDEGNIAYYHERIKLDLTPEEHTEMRKKVYGLDTQPPSGWQGYTGWDGPNGWRGYYSKASNLWTDSPGYIGMFHVFSEPCSLNDLPDNLKIFFREYNNRL